MKNKKQNKTNTVVPSILQFVGYSNSLTISKIPLNTLKYPVKNHFKIS